jgi:hypothetical protein
MPCISAHSLSRQLLRGRFGMWQALVAEFANPHLVDRLMWPSPLGARLANVCIDRHFQCEFHRKCFFFTRRGLGSNSPAR